MDSGKRAMGFKCASAAMGLVAVLVLGMGCGDDGGEDQCLGIPTCAEGEQTYDSEAECAAVATGCQAESLCGLTVWCVADANCDELPRCEGAETLFMSEAECAAAGLQCEEVTSCGESAWCGTQGTASLQACVVDGVEYPSGQGDGIDDPFSCNTCGCEDGQLLFCTEADCPEACPEGTAPGRECARCGPADGCEAIHIGCLPTCDGDGDCEDSSGMCVNGLCAVICG